MNVTFNKWDCEAVITKYFNGRAAIILVDSVTRSPIATASVNLTDAYVGPGEVAIKNYSENEGMLDALVVAGIVSEPVSFATSGFVEIPICNLLKGEAT